MPHDTRTKTKMDFGPHRVPDLLEDNLTVATFFEATSFLLENSGGVADWLAKTAVQEPLHRLTDDKCGGLNIAYQAPNCRGKSNLAWCFRTSRFTFSSVGNIGQENLGISNKILGGRVCPLQVPWHGTSTQTVCP